MNKKRAVVVVGVTGSIAAYKACEIVSLFKKDGKDVHVIMTEEAHKFVGESAFQALSQNKVVTDMFTAPGEWNAAHVSLARKADLILIAPATANIIAKIANGICDDMLTCTVCAARTSVLIAPAMNGGMYKNAITQSNIKKLKKIGYNFVGPVKGRLVCGDTDIGRMTEPEDIFAEAKRLLK